LRAQTTGEILEAARRRLAADGSDGLSLRAIARDLDTSVSALYRYFPSRDDLLTELLVEAFDAQADAVESAARAHDEPGAAIRAALRAYRRWSLDHLPEFALAYGAPVAGYVAPAERTIRAGVRVGGILIDLVTRAWATGGIDAALVADRQSQLSPEEADGLAALIDRRQYTLPTGLMSLTVDMLIRLHGFVVMEAFGQIRPLTADPESTYERTIDDALVACGFDVH
jgi:AcrR family transcriptional regulator